jgi:hypothetical protein
MLSNNDENVAVPKVGNDFAPEAVDQKTVGWYHNLNSHFLLDDGPTNHVKPSTSSRSCLHACRTVSCQPRYWKRILLVQL